MIVLEIRCDTCGAVGISRHGDPAHILRKELRVLGWQCVESGGKDYCPKCKMETELNRKKSKFKPVNRYNPPPPESLVGALQDRVFVETGPVRPGKSVKYHVEKKEI